MEVPEIHYTRSGDVAIAYQTAGGGTFDLVFVPTFANLVFPWLNRDWKSFYERLASFARLIMLDKRGTGLSDRPRDLGTLEARMDDIRAVLDAVGAERAVLVGAGGGGQPCAMFAATYPERTRALVLVNTPARAVRTEDYPYGLEPDAWREQLREIRQLLGRARLLRAAGSQGQPERGRRVRRLVRDLPTVQCKPGRGPELLSCPRRDRSSRRARQRQRADPRTPRPSAARRDAGRGSPRSRRSVGRVACRHAHRDVRGHRA